MKLILLRVIGRMLFITFLLTSAYNHLENPSSCVASFKRTYLETRQIHQAFSYLPDQNQIQKHIKFEELIRIIGIIEIIISIQIFIGEKVGGILFCAYLLAYGVGAYLKAIILMLRTKQIQNIYQLLPELIKWIILFGMGLIFINRPHLQKQKLPV